MSIETVYVITAQQAFELYGKKRTKEERLEYISAKIMSICEDETSMEIHFLSEYEVQVLENKGFVIKNMEKYFVISWDMEGWKHW